MVRQAKNTRVKNCYLLRSFVTVLVAIVCMGNGWVSAQLVDENTPQDTLYTGVGADGADYLAQSFLANLTSVNQIGIWLQRATPEGEVNLMLTRDNGANRPDLSAVLYSSNLIVPDSVGAWHFETGFNAVVMPGQRYWIVVDGHNNLTTTGESCIGISNTFTDTNEPMLRSTNGGAQWGQVAGMPMAINVEGDSCTFSLSILPAEPVVCPGETTELIVPTGYLSYAWNNGATSSTISVGQSGVYTVSVVDQNLCIGIGTVEVDLGTQPFIGLDSSFTICRGDSVILSVIPFYNSYQWSTGETVPVISVKEPGLYTVEVASAAGCIARDSTVLVVDELPSLSLGNDSSLCQGEFIFLDAGEGFTSYAWSNGQGGRSIFVDMTDSVWVEVVDSSGCAGSSDTVAIVVNPIPIRPTVTQEFEGLTTGVSVGYQWYSTGGVLPGETGQNLSNPEPGDYFVVISNEFGCSAVSDTVTVTTEPVGNFISEGFSPNGDGLNEVFFVEGIGRYPQNVLVVYNRYGDEVLRKSPYQNDWTGHGKSGLPLADGNYFYVLDLGNGDPVRKGVVLIQR